MRSTCFSLSAAATLASPTWSSNLNLIRFFSNYFEFNSSDQGGTPFISKTKRIKSIRTELLHLDGNLSDWTFEQLLHKQIQVGCAFASGDILLFVFAATEWKVGSAHAGHLSHDARASKGILTVLASPHEGHSHDD